MLEECQARTRFERESYAQIIDTFRAELKDHTPEVIKNTNEDYFLHS